MSVRCERCGARVENEFDHAQFHEIIDGLVAWQNTAGSTLVQLVGVVGRLNDLTHDMRKAQ